MRWGPAHYGCTTVWVCMFQSHYRVTETMGVRLSAQTAQSTARCLHQRSTRPACMTTGRRSRTSACTRCATGVRSWEPHHNRRNRRATANDRCPLAQTADSRARDRRRWFYMSSPQVWRRGFGVRPGLQRLSPGKSAECRCCR